MLELNSNKKFDIVLMNPPYDRDLHLKFIDKCINICNTLINISPGGFINNIGIHYSKKNKNIDEIIRHLHDYEFIDWNEGNILFNTGHGIQSELCIGVYKNAYTEGHPIFDKKIESIYKKIRFTTKTNLRNHFIRKDKLSENGVRIYRMHYDPKTPYYDNIICTEGKAVEGIDFNSKNEKNNFINSIKTWVYEFMFLLKDTNPAHLPYLDDYTKEWTDESLYEYFNISKEEKDIIKQFIEKANS